jgi:hypothetical protein
MHKNLNLLAALFLGCASLLAYSATCDAELAGAGIALLARRIAHQQRIQAHI